MLSEGEKKVARDYLKTEAKKLEDNEKVAAAAREANGNQREDTEDGDDDDDDDEEKEEDDRGVYIPGCGLLNKINSRDLRRFGQENEFEKRYGCRCLGV